MSGGAYKHDWKSPTLRRQFPSVNPVQWAALLPTVGESLTGVERLLQQSSTFLLPHHRDDNHGSAQQAQTVNQPDALQVGDNYLHPGGRRGVLWEGFIHGK